MRADVLRIIEGFNREGMTGAKDVNVSQAKFDLYKQLLDEGVLSGGRLHHPERDYLIFTGPLDAAMDLGYRPSRDWF